MTELQLSQFQYDLPDERIARFPLAQRDASKLLVYRSGQITHTHFHALPSHLPAGSFLVFNNTKVIPARLHFVRETGAVIELFLLSPLPAELPMPEAMQATTTSVWQCLVGNRKRWRASETLRTTFAGLTLTASWHDRDASAVRFQWTPGTETFAHVIQRAGEIPLPPYLKRDAIDADRDTYQTVYSKAEGAVAAPTAGLHFTPAVFDALAQHGFGYDELTLHVGAGTFQPIKTDDVRQHQMHTEQVIYTRQNVDTLLANVDRLLPVGTTSMRSLESLYWMGVRLLRSEPAPFLLDQHYAYEFSDPHPNPADALRAVQHYMQGHGLETLVARTGIYITPGYQMKLCRGIITNFHQPGSTLILLIAALVGNNWRRIYQEALQNDYRFLSYGDSSLLIP